MQTISSDTLTQAQEYCNMKDLIITKEAWILRELGFHLDVEHPHKFLLNYLSMLRTAKVRGSTLCCALGR